MMDLSKFSSYTSDNKNLKVNFKPLNFDLLQKIGVFRVTNQGLDKGYNPDSKAGFSIVSAYNDAVKDSQSKNWPDNPEAYAVVRDMFMTRPQDITAHKYLQIVESAKQLGVPESQIFLTKEQIVNPAYNDPFGITVE